LIDNILLSHNDLFKLFKDGLINERQKICIEEAQTEANKNETLLSIMIRKNNAVFHKFLNYIENSLQKPFIVDILLDRGMSLLKMCYFCFFDCLHPLSRGRGKKTLDECVKKDLVELGLHRE